MNTLNKLAFALFGRYVRENKERYTPVINAVRQAHLSMPWDIYLSSTYFYSTIVGILGAIIGLLFSPLFSKLYVTYLKTVPFTGLNMGDHAEFIFSSFVIVFLAIFLAIISFYLILSYPGLIANVRKSKIDISLPHGVAYMHAMSKGGLSLISVLKSLSQHIGLYGEFAEEINYIVLDTEIHGNDLVTSLKNAAASTQSEKLRDFLDNLINVAQTSGDLETFFGNMVDYYQETAESDQAMYLEMLGMLAETYITVFVAGPLFLITIVIVMGLMGPGNLMIFKVLIYAVIPLSAAAFSVLLSVVSIGSDSKQVKKYYVSKKIQHYDDVKTSFSNDDGRNIRRLLRSLRWTNLIETGRNPLKIFFVDPAKVFYISIPAGLIYLISSLYSKKITIELVDDILVITVLIILVPFLIFYEIQTRRIRAIEDSIPAFLRRMSSINDVGMTLSDAIRSITMINLGVLSIEVKLMYKDIVWSNSVLGALTKFEKRVRTLSISRIVTLITKASESTGNIRETLRVAANEATLTDKLRKQKFTVLFSYLIVVYISFAVFLLVLYVFATMFLPKIPDASSAAGMGMLAISNQKAQYTLLFMHASVIQGFFSGIIVGQMMGALGQYYSVDNPNTTQSSFESSTTRI
ncbi:MAG: type II secretion system F family protein [Candidatus Methanoperedens sp.]|nr:type II secretion system F family protein [Candidatus Methanoperedens sp.]